MSLLKYKCLLFMVALHLTITSSSPTPEIQFDRIINGYEVDIRKVPYFAALKRREKSRWNHLCGATLLSTRAALTAAHCVDRFVSAPSSLRITVGTTKRAAGGKNYIVSKVRSHEYYTYNNNTLVNDIAMLITAKAITFGKTVGKMPFAPKGFYLPAGTEALITGFGKTEYRDLSPTLLGAHVTIKEQEKCARAYKKIGLTIFPGNVCAYATNPPREAGAGDSGGPMVARGHLVGIVSWGNARDDGYPGVYTRVSEYASWISKRLNETLN